MDVLGIRIAVAIICLILLVLCVIVLCKKKLDFRFKLIVLSIICFILAGLHLCYVFGFALNSASNYILSFLGIVAGFSFYISANLVKSEEKFEVTSKSNAISFVISGAVALAFICAFTIVKVKSQTPMYWDKFIFLILIASSSIVCLFFFVRDLFSKTNGSKYLKIVKIVDAIMVGELVVGALFVIFGVMANLLWMGIVFIVFILIQCAILAVIYGGIKNE